MLLPNIARFGPTAAGEKERASMQNLAVAACSALDLRWCTAHVEFIVTPTGPRLLEVGVRPGGSRARMLWRSYGVDLPSAYVNAVCGRPPDLLARQATPFCIVTPFPRHSGVFAGTVGLKRVTGLPTYESHRVYHQPGEPAGTAADGHWQVLSIELSGPTRTDLERDAARIWAMNDLVDVRPVTGQAS